MSRRPVVSLCTTVLILFAAATAFAQSDIILRASDVTAMHGNWGVAYDGSAAGGQYVSSTDYGWSVTNAPFANPNDFVDFSFGAAANTPYRVWVRLRAAGNSKYNDSVWVQYSDAVTAGGARLYPIGSTSGLNLNLERCSGCGVSGWGWQDGAYWLSQATTIQFSSSGTHTLRVQIREDGAQIDQIVLSPARHFSCAPGGPTDDSTIVSATSGGTTAPSTAVGPYLGSPVSLPGRVEAENFDNGAQGTSYGDSSVGNAGGAYRQTNVDIEASSEGGYDVGWITGGEWMNYAVKVGTAGSYTVKLRVASPNGASMHVGFNGPSSVWTTVAIPATGGWQNWTTVSVPVTLGAGSQLMTLAYDTSGFNINYIDVASGASVPAPVASTPSAGPTVSTVSWNVQVNDSGSGHARSAIDYLMNLTPRPQILVLQEAHLSQYNTYISQLQARTGQTWQGVMKTHCPPGAWNGSSCSGSEDEGVAVFTSLPVSGSGGTYLPAADQWHSARAVARLAVNVNGVTMQVFSVHLPIVASARYNAMSMLKGYASNYSSPQIAGGDFNADADQICTTSGMSPNFKDTWAMAGSGDRLTAFTPSPSMKIDYWFTDASSRARPQWTVVARDPGTFSDHWPVMAYFSVQ